MQTNIAILSTAHIHTKSFLESIAKAGDGRTARLIWDDVEERGQRYATDFGTQFEPNLETVLKDPTLDGFIICAENTRHLPLLEKVLPIGKPVFCEKPLVSSRADLEKLRAVVAKSSAPLLSGYFQPFSAEHQGVIALLNEGALGKVTRMRYRNAHHAAYGRWFDNPDVAWFHNPELAGGGAFMDMGTHALHLARTMFGPVREVFAVIENHTGEYPAVDDFGVAHLRFESGVLGTIEAGWTQTGGIGGLEVTGSGGCIWNQPGGLVQGKPGDAAAPVASGVARPTRVDRLVSIIRGELPQQEQQADLEACLDVVGIMAAAYESAASGKWVAVNK